MPLCIEAATSEQKALVLTNREIWERLQKVEQELEQAEFERDCWAQAARKFMLGKGDRHASCSPNRPARASAHGDAQSLGERPGLPRSS
jgi:hypothetical protein